MGSDSYVNQLFSEIEYGIKKTKSPKFKAALKKLLIALEQEAGGGIQYEYVPSINSAWNAIKTIQTYNRC